MADRISVPRGCGYVITPKGRADLRELPDCECRLSIDGLLWVCQGCDTVYAHWQNLRMFDDRYRQKTSRS
jgi:hypothetical protein